LDKYHVKIRPEVFDMLDTIYENICYRSLDNSVAGIVITAIEDAILSLADMPQRGATVKNGLYANTDYRQLVVKNHLIIYAVREERKEVVVVFVKSVKMSI